MQQFLLLPWKLCNFFNNTLFFITLIHFSKLLIDSTFNGLSKTVPYDQIFQITKGQALALILLLQIINFLLLSV